MIGDRKSCRLLGPMPQRTLWVMTLNCIQKAVSSQCSLHSNSGTRHEICPLQFPPLYFGTDLASGWSSSAALCTIHCSIVIHFWDLQELVSDFLVEERVKLAHKINLYKGPPGHSWHLLIKTNTSSKMKDANVPNQRGLNQRATVTQFYQNWAEVGSLSSCLG